MTPFFLVKCEYLHLLVKPCQDCPSFNLFESVFHAGTAGLDINFGDIFSGYVFLFFFLMFPPSFLKPFWGPYFFRWTSTEKKVSVILCLTFAFVRSRRPLHRLCSLIWRGLETSCIESILRCMFWYTWFLCQLCNLISSFVDQKGVPPLTKMLENTVDAAHPNAGRMWLEGRGRWPSERTREEVKWFTRHPFNLLCRCSGSRLPTGLWEWGIPAGRLRLTRVFDGFCADFWFRAWNQCRWAWNLIIWKWVWDG